MKSDSVPMTNRSPLERKVVDGALWNAVQLLAARGINLLVRLILARLLLPEYFGLVGMAAVFIDTFSAIRDLGISAALIQKKSSEISDVHYNSAFWSTLAFTLVLLGILIFGVAPFAAWFYDQPSLLVIIPILGLGTSFQTLGSIQRVILTRDLRFRELSLTEVAAMLVSGVTAVGFALAGYGVWALIVQDLLYAGVMLPVLWFITRWKPRFQFSGSAFNQIFKPGITDTTVRLITFITKNIDYLLVGRFLGPELLGVYTLAFILTDTFRQQIWAVLSNILFPVYSQIQDELSLVKAYYLKAIKYNLLFILPIMLVLVYFTEPIVRHFFGERWLLSVLPIQILALSSIIVTIGGTSGSVLRGLGKFSLNLKITLTVFFFVALPAFIFGIRFFGIAGAALAVLLYQCVSRIVFQFFMKAIIAVSEIDIIQTVRVPAYGALATLPILAISRIAFTQPSFWETVFLVAATLTIYIATIVLMDFKSLAGLVQLYWSKPSETAR
jgi:O-antigen/teichoic acid export membrane protein